jgi:hypothetical protein
MAPVAEVVVVKANPVPAVVNPIENSVKAPLLTSSAAIALEEN